MLDYFEIDFLNVESDKSGDAILLRYSISGVTRIHVTDGGFQDTGDKVVKHINEYYGYPRRIDAVIASHPNSDHVGGLQKVLEDFEVSALWMLRPWLYVDELIDRFAYYKIPENLADKLKEIYSNIAELEEIAEENDIPILEPFQGKKIGDFTVLAPTKQRYLDLVVASEKTPEVTNMQSLWGEEFFPSEGSSYENEMSVVQYANLCEKKILLTADAGRGALTEAANSVRKILPGIDFFQVPHHGSRRNVSTELLDLWLGKRLPESEKPEEGTGTFTAIISASEEDKDHPRKAVVRACIHRGAMVISNEELDLCVGHNSPTRAGWTAATPLEYPPDQEKD